MFGLKADQVPTNAIEFFKHAYNLVMIANITKIEINVITKDNSEE